MRKVRILWPVAVLALLSTVLFAALAQAQVPKTWDVTLTWDANTEPDLREYRLYQNGEEVDVIPAGTETASAVLEAGSYTWYLTAVDQSLNESGPSGTAKLTLDEVPPVMEGVTIGISISIHVNP